MDRMKPILDGLRLELKRGFLTLSVLSELKSLQYGYSLVQRLDHVGIPIEAGTLYPLLRRLEAQGLLKSSWETSGAKPRKYYILSQLGEDVLQALTKEWNAMTITMKSLLNGGTRDD